MNSKIKSNWGLALVSMFLVGLIVMLGAASARAQGLPGGDFGGDTFSCEVDLKRKSEKRADKFKTLWKEFLKGRPGRKAPPIGATIDVSKEKGQGTLLVVTAIAKPDGTFTARMYYAGHLTYLELLGDELKIAGEGEASTEAEGFVLSAKCGPSK